MSNLLPWLRKRRERFYEGEQLQASIDSFLKMVEDGATVREFDDAIIVLEDYGLEGNLRAWLLFDKFTRGVVRAMQQVSRDFEGSSLYASTHDIRIRDVLVKMGFTQYNQDKFDFYLVIEKQVDKNGM